MGVDNQAEKVIRGLEERDEPKRREGLEQLSKHLVDQGKLIEAGWISLRLLAIPRDASAIQLDEMHMAFFAGAQHLFGSIMSVLDTDADPTDDDLRRMDLINEELNLFVVEMKQRIKGESIDAGSDADLQAGRQ